MKEIMKMNEELSIPFVQSVYESKNWTTYKIYINLKKPMDINVVHLILSLD